MQREHDEPKSNRSFPIRISRPMPYKDVKLNEQIRYILEPQNSSSVQLKMSDSKSRIVDKSIESFPFEKKVIYASCFKDGVYRYPKDF